MSYVDYCVGINQMYKTLQLFDNKICCVAKLLIILIKWEMSNIA